MHTKPFFLIIGAQKSGTTALFSYLAKHPQIVPPLQKELDFFSCESRFRMGLDFYHSHFPTVEEIGINSVTFDASPDYLLKPQAPSRIFEYNPDIKLIAVLRDPVKRAFSAWNMYVKLFDNDTNWFLDWMKRCDCEFDAHSIKRRKLPEFHDFEYAVKEELPFAERNELIEATLLLHGKYSEQLIRYLRYFDRKSLLVIESETLRRHPIKSLYEVTGFLGLSDHLWENEDLSPVFEGEYRTKLPETAKALLSQYYLKYNRKLFNMIERRYDWL